MQRWLLILCALIVFGQAGQAPLQAAEALKWRKEANQTRVDADLENLPLAKLLKQISEHTGWKIYVEPNTSYQVTTRFRDLPVNEALRRLLGDLDFALVPQTKGPSQLFVYRGNMAEATQLIAGLDESGEGDKASTNRVPNELIVTLKPGGETIEELAKRLGATIVGRMDELNTYRLRFEDEEATEAARKSLASNPNVEAIEDNFYVKRPENPVQISSNGGVLPPNLKATAAADGSKLIVGLIDTGVDPELSAVKQFLMDSIRVIEGDTGTGGQTHGTAMAETIIRGLVFLDKDGSSTVMILPVDVFGSGGSTTSFSVAQGIMAALNGGAQIINMSLGSDSPSKLTEKIIAQNPDRFFIAAAGNSPVTTPTYPAAINGVLAVTAGDRNGNIASWANYGDFVDVVAPGVSIVHQNNYAYFVSGTSPATAYISGVAAGLMSESGASRTEAETQIKQNFSRPTAKP